MMDEGFDRQLQQHSTLSATVYDKCSKAAKLHKVQESR
jgi:hypothetical protein